MYFVGALGFSKTTGTGFWIIHSVPVLPGFNNPSNYEYQTPELKYGQTVFCMSTHYQKLGGIGKFSNAECSS